RRAECPAGAARRRSRVSARGRRHPGERHRRRAAQQRRHSRSLSRRVTAKNVAVFGIFDIYFVETLFDGFLLGGGFALLALGLNVVFGLIDLVWICYAELIMIGMYGMYFLYVSSRVPFLLPAPICIAGVGLLAALLHVLVIQPLLGTPPINQ